MHSLIRDGFHYILNGDGSEELYNLMFDPGEMNDLAADSGAVPRVERLRRILRSVPGAAPLPGDTGGELSP